MRSFVDNIEIFGYAWCLARIFDILCPGGGRDIPQSGIGDGSSKTAVARHRPQNGSRVPLWVIDWCCFDGPIKRLDLIGIEPRDLLGNVSVIVVFVVVDEVGALFLVAHALKNVCQEDQEYQSIDCL